MEEVKIASIGAPQRANAQPVENADNGAGGENNDAGTGNAGGENDIDTGAEHKDDATVGDDCCGRECVSCPTCVVN